MDLARAWMVSFLQSINRNLTMPPSANWLHILTCPWNNILFSAKFSQLEMLCLWGLWCSSSDYLVFDSCSILISERAQKKSQFKYQKVYVHKQSSLLNKAYRANKKYANIPVSHICIKLPGILVYWYFGMVLIIGKKIIFAYLYEKLAISAEMWKTNY